MCNNKLLIKLMATILGAIYVLSFLFIANKYLSSGVYFDIIVPQNITLSAKDDVSNVDIKIKNKMISSISSNEDYYITYHILDSNKNAIKFDNIRTHIESIAPGKKEQLSVDIQKLTPGKYIIEFDIVKENEFWFKDKHNKTIYSNLIVQ